MSRISHRSSSSLLQPNLKQMSSLLEFKLPPQQLSPVYHDAIHLPHFLTQNLKANNRRVKQLSGENAVLTAFYYPLLRLAFDLEDGKEVAERARRILTGDQQFGDGELQDKTLSDKQYRSFLSQFMDILQREGPLQESVKPFPIIDTILLKMFQRIVPVTLLLRDEDDQKVAGRVLSFLSNKFGMKLQAISGCFKLVQADTFIYVQSITEIYLVYVEQLQGIRQETENESQPLSSNNSFRRGSINTQKSNKYISNNNEKTKNFETVINILQSHNSTGSKSNTNKRASLSSNTSKANIDKIKENITQQQMAKSQCSELSIPSNNFSNNSATSTPLQTSPRVSESSKMVKTYNGIPPAKQQYSKFSSQIYTQDKPSNLAIFSSFSPAAHPPSKNSIQQSQESICDDSGYMKFTQGGVLELLDEKFRQEIKMIKKKYRSERGNVKPFL